MDFINLVATRMYQDGMFIPDNPRNVQIYMTIIIKELQDSEIQSEETFRLRMQGHIEIQKHIQLFGTLDN